MFSEALVHREYARAQRGYTLKDCIYAKVPWDVIKSGALYDQRSLLFVLLCIRTLIA